MLVEAPPLSLLQIAPSFERQLRATCEGIIAGTRAGRAPSTTADWLLGNYSFLRTHTREIRESLPRGYFRRLPKLPRTQTPRLLSAAEELLSCQSALNADTLRAHFEHWQESTVLLLAELWAIRPIVKIALLKRLANGISRLQLESPELEHEVRWCITKLRELDDVIWPELIEQLSAIDCILRNDPARAYAVMDFETRDQYRRAVEEIALYSRFSEQETAAKAIDLAGQTGQHVGVYLVGAALPELRRSLSSRRSFGALVRDAVRAVPSFVYLGGSLILTIGLLWAVTKWAGPLPLWFLALLVVPASQAALGISNLLVSYFLPPTVRPRMDFRGGIPADCRTAVVVPTLLLSKGAIGRLIGNLEISFLANRDRNLSFVLLTDYPDGPSQDSGKNGLLEECAAGIRELNSRYSDGVDDASPFLLLHREVQWNGSEGKWMGRERKRGKLESFNHFLLTKESHFDFTVGDLRRLESVKYVITLDSDTQLPRDTAWKLVGTMAHPLNLPVFDERNMVRSGYALMQPRVGVSMESAAKSEFAAIYSGQVGFDPYTTAVSDVYQDLFGRATFTGKGIYHVAAFERATSGRFPENALLSHDLIEGEYVRAGLVTDLEVIDDYPSRYQAYSKRKHRWVRGDWQIAMWLLPLVPDAKWKWTPNPLPLISRWKILDNLRRSLLELSLLVALLCAWFVPGIDAVAATFAAALLLVVPAYAEIPISLFRIPPARFLRAWGWTRFSDWSRAHTDACLVLAFLPVQALLMADAIVRTLYRRLVSRRNLLEWESMAQTELAVRGGFRAEMLLDGPLLARWIRGWHLTERYLAAGVAVALAVWFALAFHLHDDNTIAFAATLLWMVSPGLMIWLNGAPQQRESRPADEEFLRSVALSTWRYFEDHENERDHWLVPDNVQEDPFAIAHRTSPTNIGLQLNAVVAAYEFGHLTSRLFGVRIARICGTLDQLQRDRGHFYNWYDTRSLAPMEPRFLSTVDSGNLLASLIVTRQACLAALEKPLIARNTLHSLSDHLLQLRDAIPLPSRTSSVVRHLDNLRRQFAADPDDLFFWEGILTEARALTQNLTEHLEWTAVRLETKAPVPAREMRYWLDALLSGIDSALTDLIELAPWLKNPFETELRLSFSNPRLQKLMSRLRRVPKLSELLAVYSAVEEEIGDLQASSSGIHQSTLRTLAELRGALAPARSRALALTGELSAQAADAAVLSDGMKFGFLLDDRRKLFRIGWNSETGTLDNSSYDLLASEARTAVFLAIARGEAPRESWFQLGRKLTHYRGHRTLLSWSGTMFEYLMPALFMQTWPGTLLGESLRSVVRIQRLYARERGVPWGISESAHSERDGALNYQYRAFGVPSCGLDRIASDDLVVAPYASVLSLMVDPAAATENLRQMASRGWLGRYGFYEAVDFRPKHRGSRRSEVIRAFMAHHQGMSFLALANVLLDNPIRKLFHADPAVLATELLLQERMPTMIEAQAPEETFPELEAITGEAVAKAAAAGAGSADDLVRA